MLTQHSSSTSTATALLISSTPVATLVPQLHTSYIETLVAFAQPFYSLLPNYDPQTDRSVFRTALLCTTWQADKLRRQWELLKLPSRPHPRRQRHRSHARLGRIMAWRSHRSLRIQVLNVKVQLQRSQTLSNVRLMAYLTDLERVHSANLRDGLGRDRTRRHLARRRTRRSLHCAWHNDRRILERRGSCEEGIGEVGDECRC